MCAGAKSFLDLPRTLERLETLGVPVIGLDTDGRRLPRLLVPRAAACRSPTRWRHQPRSAAVVRAARALGYGGGVLVVTPVPEADEVPFEELTPIINAALA